MAPLKFELVELGLKNIYGDFSLTDIKEIDHKCELAREFVLASGWTIEDYIGRLMGWTSEKLN